MPAALDFWLYWGNTLLFPKFVLTFPLSAPDKRGCDATRRDLCNSECFRHFLAHPRWSWHSDPLSPLLLQVPDEPDLGAYVFDGDGLPQGKVDEVERVRDGLPLNETFMIQAHGFL